MKGMSGSNLLAYCVYKFSAETTSYLRLRFCLILIMEFFSQRRTFPWLKSLACRKMMDSSKV
jgi:hypothetical protein